MYLLFAAITILLTLAYRQGDISEIPLSQLTLKLIGDRLFTFGGYGISIFFAYKSFQKDRIWPWRWTIAYLGNFAIRIGVCLLCGALAAFLYQNTKSGFSKFVIVGGATIMAIWAMFTSELKHFKEKPGSKYAKTIENHEISTTVDT